MTRSAPPTRETYSIFHVLGTRWFDNDIYGHMNNTVHYQLIDTVVNSYLLEQDLLNLDDSSTVFLVVESGCSYFSEIKFPDVVTAGLRVAKLGRSSIRYEVGLFSGESNEAAAGGHFVHVNVDRITRKPRPLDDNTRDNLGRLLINGPVS
jgi:acyl-CoA thioester hydrolase